MSSFIGADAHPVLAYLDPANEIEDLYAQLHQANEKLAEKNTTIDGLLDNIDALNDEVRDLKRFSKACALAWEQDKRRLKELKDENDDLEAENRSLYRSTDKYVDAYHSALHTLWDISLYLETHGLTSTVGTIFPPRPLGFQASKPIDERTVYGPDPRARARFTPAGR